MSHFNENNETSNRQLQITHVELKLYSDACSESTIGPALQISHSYFTKAVEFRPG